MSRNTKAPVVGEEGTPAVDLGVATRSVAVGITAMGKQGAATDLAGSNANAVKSSSHILQNGMRFGSIHCFSQQ